MDIFGSWGDGKQGMGGGPTTSPAVRPNPTGVEERPCDGGRKKAQSCSRPPPPPTDDPKQSINRWQQLPKGGWNTGSHPWLVFSLDPSVLVKSIGSGASLVAQWLRIRLPGFPGGTVVENLPANVGDTGSSPGLGRSHMLQSN